MNHFQTPPDVANYMALQIPPRAYTILEPTPGDGNLVKVMQGFSRTITAPEDFFKMERQAFDCVVMNPPFTPMALGYQILFDCMEMSRYIIALMPWLTIINSERRAKKISDFGVKKIVHLPRHIFPGSRVQTCILILHKGWLPPTTFEFYGNTIQYRR